MRGTLESGNLVSVNWQARVSDDLGAFTLELVNSPVSHFMQEALKLAALQSACGICDVALPERDGHSGLFHGLNALFEVLQSDVWGEAYVMWEIAFLKEIGFSLDLSKCAGGSDSKDLAYVSPKTGRAVSREAGEPYKDKLLLLPSFLSPLSHVSYGDGAMEDVLTGLQMSGYFFEHWVFTHHTKGIPEARLRFQERFAKTVNFEVLER